MNPYRFCLCKLLLCTAFVYKLSPKLFNKFITSWSLCSRAFILIKIAFCGSLSGRLEHIPASYWSLLSIKTIDFNDELQLIPSKLFSGNQTLHKCFIHWNGYCSNLWSFSKETKLLKVQEMIFHRPLTSTLTSGVIPGLSKRNQTLCVFK